MRSGDIEITRRDSSAGGSYEAIENGGNSVGELIYDRLGNDVIVAKHTEVDKSHRGRGIAQRLVAKLVADARTGGEKIRPRCSFVRSQFDAHPEWGDLRLPD